MWIQILVIIALANIYLCLEIVINKIQIEKSYQTASICIKIPLFAEKYKNTRLFPSFTSFIGFIHSNQVIRRLIFDKLALNVSGHSQEK